MRAALLGLACAACTVQPAAAPVHVPAPAAAGPSARECSGNDSLQIVNETIESAGIALDLHGNCQVLISNSRIVGVVDVHGNSHVTIENSTIEGGVDLHGNAVLSTAGSTYTGGIDRHGNAYLEDRGGNRW